MNWWPSDYDPGYYEDIGWALILRLAAEESRKSQRAWQGHFRNQSFWSEG
jgi:hypothetical protein